MSRELSLLSLNSPSDKTNLAQTRIARPSASAGGSMRVWRTLVLPQLLNRCTTIHLHLVKISNEIKTILHITFNMSLRIIYLIQFSLNKIGQAHS
jgi:hypothetical protein